MSTLVALKIRLDLISGKNAKQSNRGCFTYTGYNFSI